MDMYSNKKNLLFCVSICIFVILSIFTTINVNALVISNKNNIEITVNNNVVDLKYKKEVNRTKQEKILAYEDSNKNEYAIINNEVVGFFQSKHYSNEYAKKNMFNKSSESVINNSKELLSLYSNIDLDDYILTETNYSNTYRETSFNYSKYINDIKTNDGVIVSINDDGTLASFLAPRQGLFDNLKTSVTKSKVENFIKDVMSKKYSGVDYEISYMTIDYQEEKYVVDSLIVIKYINYNETINILYDL